MPEVIFQLHRNSISINVVVCAWIGDARKACCADPTPFSLVLVERGSNTNLAGRRCPSRLNILDYRKFSCNFLCLCHMYSVREFGEIFRQCRGRTPLKGGLIGRSVGPALLFVGRKFCPALLKVVCSKFDRRPQCADDRYGQQESPDGKRTAPCRHGGSHKGIGFRCRVRSLPGRLLIAWNVAHGSARPRTEFACLANCET